MHLTRAQVEYMLTKKERQYPSATQIQKDEKMKCIIETCSNNGENFIKSEGYLIPVCNPHYEQAKKIGGQLEKHTKETFPSSRFVKVKINIARADHYKEFSRTVFLQIARPQGRNI